MNNGRVFTGWPRTARLLVSFPISMKPVAGIGNGNVPNSWRWSQKAQNAGNGGKDRLQGLTGGDGRSGGLPLFNLVEQLSGGQDAGVLVAEIQAEGVGKEER